jgi:hypothetical protein
MVAADSVRRQEDSATVAHRVATISNLHKHHPKTNPKPAEEEVKTGNGVEPRRPAKIHRGTAKARLQRMMHRR